MSSKDKKVIVLAHSVEPNGISGSETILIQLFKRLGKKYSVRLFTWQPGYEFYRRQGLDEVTYSVSSVPVLANFYLSFFLRSIWGIWKGFTIHLKEPSSTYIYPSSDFWPDALPAMLLKLRYRRAKLLANFYLEAPNPFTGFSEKGRLKRPTLNGIFYWLLQKPVYYFFRFLADAVIVTSEPDAKKFPKQQKRKKVFVVRGGVDLENIRTYLQSQKNTTKEYDAVFMGRFHPQKGVVELVDIWQTVVQKKPDALLVMIGDGPLMPTVKAKIQQKKLEKSIFLTGYLLKPEQRFSYFAKSKIALHPALYDSGGMAAAEAMAFGLPGISYDLEALKTYYPHGMVKVPIGDQNAFAQAILDLLHDKLKYIKLKKEAEQLIEREWNWNQRAEDFETFLKSV